MVSEKANSPNSLELRQVPDGWDKKTLGELVTFQRGYDLPIKDIIEGDWPVVTSQGIMGFHISYKANGPGIVLGRSGTLGEPKFISFAHYWPHNTTLFSKKFHNCDPKFAFYILKSLTLKTYNSGSAVPSLNRNYIHLISLVVPQNLMEQKAIAKILSDLDTKIELNRKMNKTLESIAQAIFKHWFIDFEFPNEEEKPYKSSGGEMINSELGEIPKGWEVRKLSDMGTFKNGINYTREESGSQEFYIVNVRNIANNKFILKEDLDKIKLDFTKFNEYLLKQNDIVIARSASPGESSLVLGSTDRILHSGFSIRYRLNNPDYKLYLYLILQNSKKILSRISIGTVLKSLNQAALRNIMFVLPPHNILVKFNSVNFIDKIECNSLEFKSLLYIRDSLLPKLMSGKIRVPLEE